MIPRTTEVIGEIYPFDKEQFNQYCEENGLDPKYILEFSSKFGTEMHRWCLERIIPEEVTDLQLATYRQWIEAVKKYKIQVIESETPLILYQGGKALCSGIRDSVCTISAPTEEIVGEAQIDLKFYSCWRGINEEYKEPSADKLKKANLQTYNYNVSDNKESMPRAVLHLMPNGFGLYPFKRRPLAIYKNFIQICEKKYNENTF